MLRTFLLTLICSTSLLSQTKDTLASFRPDSLKGDSGVDTVVIYSAKDSIVYSVRTKYMHMYRSGDIQHQTMGLKAERVSVNWSNSTLTATGVPDTVQKDSTVGRPVMKDGGEEYRGDNVTYNFRSKKGKIFIGKTEIENGFYKGDQIKKFESNVLYVQDGIYTTCDDPHPHFFFFSPRMKVRVRENVVAEPVYFFIADVPLFALPFGVFPSRGGRSSGLIMPAYGEDDRFGKMLNHLGYYFAINDYLDLSTAFDVSTRGGWQNNSALHYNKRYDFSGAFNGRWVNMTSRAPGSLSEQRINGYDVSLVHNQQINPTSRFDVNFRFSSGNFPEWSMSMDDILRQNIYSTASYWKTWGNGTRSLSISASRDQSLTTNDVNEILPSISFSQAQIFPFRKQSKSRGYSSGNDSYGFLEMLGLGYSANLVNQHSKLSRADSARMPGDTLARLVPVTEYQQNYAQSFSQGIGFSIAPKVGVFTISPSLSWNETRTWSRSETPFRQTADSSIAFAATNTKGVAGFLSTGVTASTRFFGIAQPRMFGVTALRHTVNPSVSMTYSKQIYGDNIRKYSMLASMNVGNNFEAKYQKSDSGREEKVQLLNFGGGLTYDFARDSMRFSPLGLQFRTDLGSILAISGNASYDLYKFDPAVNSRVNRFLLLDEGRIGDLTNFGLSLSTSLRGEKKQKTTATETPDAVQQEQDKVSGTPLAPSPKKIYRTIYDREDADFSIPWNISLSYSFSQNIPVPGQYFRSSSANISVSFNLTDKWQISSGASYDFVTKQHFIPSVDIARDLHCWTMNFSWFPMGYREGYRLELKVKAPQLQDIKVTKQNSNRGFYY